MFTGIVTAVGKVVSVEGTATERAIVLETPYADVVLGESIAVNGVCLTVVAGAPGSLEFDLGPETARVTSLGVLVPGTPVNLERAMRADTRVGGHFVQGHVDGTGLLTKVVAEAEFTWMTFTFPADQAAYLIPKGAVAVDGISLTVAHLDEVSFDVQIIPFTWTHTNLSSLAAGARVNLEFDMLGKYAVRAAALVAGRPAPSLP